VESSPAIVDGRAYIGAGNDGFYCFALDPGPDGQARVLWHLDGADYPDCETSPVVHEWRVYFGLGIGGQALVCADAETGKELWRLPTPAPVFSAPAIHNGRLFFGLGWGDFVNTAEEVAANLRDRLRREGRSPAEIEAAVAPIVTAGEVWAVDPADQRIIWTFKTSAVVLGAVAADGERVFFNARDGQVYSVAAADGQLHRRHDLHAPIVTSPAVGREHVYVTTLTGRLVAFEKERLTPVWQVMLRSPTISSPAVARGHVYVGTSEGGLLCVGSPGGEAPPVVWRGERGGPAAAGCADGSPIPPRGAYAWDFAAPLSEGSAEAPSRPTSPAAPLDHALYIGWSQGGLHGLRRLNADKEGWSLKPAAAWFVPTANPVRRSPAADARGVYGVDGVGGESGRYLRALDANGNELWRRAIAREAGGTFFLSGDRLFIADRPDGLSALDTSRTGAELWSVETGAVVGEPGEGPDLVLVVAATREAIALDAETGLEIWRRPLTAAPRTGPIWFDEAVWVGEEDGLTAYPIFDDARPLRAAVGAIAGPLAVADDHVFAVTADGALWAVRRARTANEASSGGELEAFRLGEVKDGWPPLVSRSVVLYAAENAIRRHDRTTGETETWTLIRPQWPGALTTPMTMADSHVFFGSERRGLVCIRPKE
jgi:outer membrane protein assembly factor BamB